MEGQHRKGKGVAPAEKNWSQRRRFQEHGESRFWSWKRNPRLKTGKHLYRERMSLVGQLRGLPQPAGRKNCCEESLTLGKKDDSGQGRKGGKEAGEGQEAAPL